MELPAHLRGRNAPSLIDRAMVGMGGALPPRITIRGNRFTLVDAAGGKRPVDTLHLDTCIVDLSDGFSKQYYEFVFEDGSDDPPTCFSINGIVPSPEAQSPQARTCAECEKNRRGSAVSKLTGAKIKACRDEKLLAVLVMGAPDMLFQLKVTPGSFKNWGAYYERCKTQGVDFNVLITRIAFEADKNGVLTFTPVNFIDTPTADIRDKAWAAKATDALVGRGGVALPAPAAPAMISATGGVQPRPFDATGAGGTPAAFMDSPQTTLTAPSSAAPASSPPKRTRRTKAEMEAERQAAAPAPQAAPFRAEPAPAPFGIATPTPTPAAVDAALDSFFK